MSGTAPSCGTPGTGRAVGYDNPPTRKGFFTDTSMCIGCKACEVACKEWNDVPEDGLSLSGMSYDNIVGLGASTWRHVAFVEQPAVFALVPDGQTTEADIQDLGMPGRGLAGRRREPRARAFPVAHGVRRVQALHERGLPRRLPHGRAVSHRVRLRRRPERHLQRLRLLRAGLPVRGHRAA